jgi:putative ABC transport system permease protein
MESLVQDLRYGVRRLAANPGFTTIAVLTLALGIGANTAIFSVLRSVLLRPLPYGEPERIAMVWNSWEGWEETWLSEPEVMDYRAGAPSIEQLAAYSTGNANITGDGEPERVASANLTANIFAALGVRTIAGRGFVEEEDRPGADPVVVLSYDLWQRRYGGDAVLGRTLRINGQPRTVIGVLAPGVRLPLEFEAERPAEIWVPLQLNLDSLGSRGSHYLYGVARLRAGATIERVNSELAAVTRGWVHDGVITAEANFQAFARKIDDVVFGDVRPALMILSGAVGFVLLIACANVANLLLARGDGRRHELAIRASLGAARRRLVAQLLTESVLLAVTGAAAGVLLAHLGLRGLIALDPVGIPRVSSVTIDATALAFTLLVAMLTGLAFGVVPALQLSAGARRDAARLSALLKEGGRTTVGRARQGFRQALVVAEVALSVVLVIGAGLLIRSFIELRRIDLGYDAANVLTMRLALPGADYPEPVQVVRFYRELQRRVEALPGVQRAGLVRLLPLTGTIGDWSITIEGREPIPHENLHGDWQVVTPGYFEAMGLRLVAGRFLEASDHENSMPVVVINETMAKEYWPSGNALGGRFRQGGADRPMVTIVGIVRDVRHNAAVEEPRTEMYHAHAQYPVVVGFAPQAMTLVVQARDGFETLAQQIRGEIRQLDANVPVSDVQTMERVVSAAFSQPRFTTWLLGCFALLALTLASIGVFGVVSYAVAQRTHEIGVRVALGARAGDVLRLIMTNAVAVALGGIGVGIVAAFALTRLLRTLVYGVGTLDPLTFLLAPGVLALVAIGASLLPARRALRFEPQRALRPD